MQNESVGTPGIAIQKDTAGNQVGVTELVVFINKCDLVDDPELIDLVEMEARELLIQHGFNGNDARVVRGSAKAALDHPSDPESNRCIVELMEALDQSIPVPKRAIDNPFLMHIEGVHTIPGRGTVATGKIDQGVISLGNPLEILGLGDVTSTVCTGIEAFKQTLERAEAGQNVGILFRGIKTEQIQRGQVIASPRTIRPRNGFSAEVYVLSKEEGRRHTPFCNGYKPQFFFRTTNVTGEIQLADETSMLIPGDNAVVSVALDNAVAIDIGTHFAMREGGRTVGAGVVTQVRE